MGARLLYRAQSGEEASVEVPPEGVFLGRATDCAVRTDDAMVSRKNCRIWLQAGRWLVEDLGSSNGTFVNNVRIQKQVLNHADVVRCGTLQVRFVEVGPVRAAAAEPEPRADPGALLAERDQKLRESRDARDRLRGEIETLTQRLEEAETELTRACQERNSERDRVADLEAIRAKLQSDRVELESDLRSAHGSIETLRGELAAARSKERTALRRLEEIESSTVSSARTMEGPAPQLGGTTLPHSVVSTPELGGATAPFEAVAEAGPKRRNTSPYATVRDDEEARPTSARAAAEEDPEMSRPTSPHQILQASLGGRTVLGMPAVDIGALGHAGSPTLEDVAPGATNPSMPAVGRDAIALETMAALKAALSSAYELLAMPGAVSPATSRPIIAALKIALERADELTQLLRP
jgi:hypothetical protein